ncbi:MAG: hypothetical protein PHQ86_08755 [Dehalococcoidales bacterium]|jgi:hypothetical protein|nr:hypothetical protein [Dehalococcoidales bacterium]
MDKIKIELNELPLIAKIYNGMTLNIYPYISIENKLQIIETYLDALFAENNVSQNYVTAEYSLMLSIVDLCTNIEIGDADIIQKLIFTGLWDEIRSSIKNYSEFRQELNDVVKMKYNEMSILSNLNILISKISGVVDNISKLDLSENGIKQLTESYQELTKNVGNLQNTFGEGDYVEKRGRGRPKKDVQ